MELLATGPALESKSPEATALPRKREKRKSKRDPVSGVLTILWGTNAQDERISRANIIDLSTHGAKFRLAERIPPGSWVMFNYHQMGASGRGTVRYCQMVRSSYQIGVEFSGGTGWKPNSNGFATELRNLSIAVDCLQTSDSPEAH